MQRKQAIQISEETACPLPLCTWLRSCKISAAPCWLRSLKTSAVSCYTVRIAPRGSAWLRSFISAAVLVRVRFVPPICPALRLLASFLHPLPLDFEDWLRSRFPSLLLFSDFGFVSLLRSRTAFSLVWLRSLIRVVVLISLGFVPSNLPNSSAVGFVPRIGLCVRSTDLASFPHFFPVSVR